MNRKVIIPVIILVVICVGVLAAFSLSGTLGGSANVGVEISPEMAETAEDLYSTVDTNIASIIENMGRTSALVHGLSTTEQENVLRSLYDQYPLAVGVSYTNVRGVVNAVVPKFSLSDISHLLREQQITESSFTDDALLIGPLASKTYGEIICILVPVYTTSGAYDGYVTIAALPALLLGTDTSSLYYKDTDYSVVIGDPTGLVIYYPDAELIGTNIYTSGLYEKGGVTNQLSPIFELESGTASYKFYDVNYGPMTENIAAWSTLDTAGRELRIVLVYNELHEEHTYRPGSSDMRQMISTVEQMLVYAKKNGRDKTLAMINDPNGQFASDEFSLFAYDIEGTALAYPEVPALVGENRVNYRDSYGIRSVDAMITRCLQGGGYLHAYSPVADTGITNAAEIELAYVLPVDDNWFVGAKQPVSSQLFSVNLNKRDLLFRNVQAAQQYIIGNGKDASLQEFANPGGQFSGSESWVFAMDYSGILLADPNQPDMIGSDYLFFTDPHGGSTIREMIVMAKNGGGFMYRELPVTNEKDTYVLQLVYVEPVDDTWYVGSVTNLDTFTEQFRRE